MGITDDIKRNEKNIGLLFQKVNEMDKTLGYIEKFVGKVEKAIWVVITGIVVAVVVSMYSNHVQTRETINAIEKLDSKIEKLNNGEIQ